jgi:hypothetical protein
MKSAIFHPFAARELGEAVEYYDEARRGLGDEFLHEVERAIAFLNQYPDRDLAPRVFRERATGQPWPREIEGVSRAT